MQVFYKGYQVCDSGVVLSRRTGRALSVSYDKAGYARVKINGRTEYVHRIVAGAFLPNPDGLPEVDHINGKRADNRAVNLRWVSRADNIAGRNERQGWQSLPFVRVAVNDAVLAWAEKVSRFYGA